jgi:hypothetical protein
VGETWFPPQERTESKRRSGSFPANCLEVRLLEGRGQDAHAVHLAAGGDELGHQPRHVLTGGALVQPCSLVGLDLDPAGAAERGRRALGHDGAAEQDHHAVADELDLAQQVRVEQHRGAAAPKLLEQQPDGPAADRVESARRLVEEQERRRADQGLRDSEPLLHALRHLLDAAVASLGESHELEQVGPFGLAA